MGKIISIFSRTAVHTVRTLGDQLRSARFAHGLTLDEISRTLVIQKRLLERLENNEFEAFPEQVYLENVLRTYSTYLGFSWEQVKEWYTASKPFYQFSSQNKSSTLSSTIRASNFWVTPSIIKNSISICILIGCFSYLVFLGYRMVRPPHLLIVSPHNNSLSASDTIEVVGRVDVPAKITINGEDIAKSDSGVFRQVVGLQEGVNIITITAAKKFGPASSESRTVIFSRHSFDKPTGWNSFYPRTKKAMVSRNVDEW